MLSTLCKKHIGPVDQEKSSCSWTQYGKPTEVTKQYAASGKCQQGHPH